MLYAEIWQLVCVARQSGPVSEGREHLALALALAPATSEASKMHTAPSRGDHMERALTDTCHLCSSGWRRKECTAQLSQVFFSEPCHPLLHRCYTSWHAISVPCSMGEGE